MGVRFHRKGVFVIKIKPFLRLFYAGEGIWGSCRVIVSRDLGLLMYVLRSSKQYQSLIH